MYSTAKKRGRPHASPMTHFIFEIQKWDLSYGLSVDNRRDRDGPYNETTLIEVEALCVLPKPIAGRKTILQVFGKRDSLEPEVYRRDPHWNARSVGFLDLPRSEGNFYTSMPHDSFPILLTSLAHGLLRYIVLYGPALSRGKSFCTYIEWRRSVDFEQGF